jgi:hypothetical protein
MGPKTIKNPFSRIKLLTRKGSAALRPSFLLCSNEEVKLLNLFVDKANSFLLSRVSIIFVPIHKALRAIESLKKLRNYF